MKTARTNLRRRNTLRTVFALVGAAVLLGIAPASAFAATVDETPTLSVTQTTAAPAGYEYFAKTPAILPANEGNGAGGQPTEGTDSNKILLNRWGSATSVFHLRTNSLDAMSTAVTSTRVGTMSAGVGASSGMWLGTAALTNFAQNLDPIKTVGIVVDRGAASMGNVIVANPLIFVIAGIITMFAAIWNKARGRDSTGLFKQTLSVVIVFVAVIVMAAGASKSLPATGISGEYKPGVASPGWFVTKIESTVSSASDAVLSGLSKVNFAAGGAQGTTPAGLSCAAYTAELDKQFTAEKKAGTASVSAISSMWATTGLQTYINAQFGANNPYAQKVWCHQLDATIGMPAGTQLELATAGIAGHDALYKSFAKTSKAFYNDDNIDNDQTMIAWAACNWDGKKWYAEEAWKKKSAQDDNADWITDQNCEDWAGKSQADSDLSAFDIGVGGAGAKQVAEITSDPQIIDFVSAWQGKDNGANGLILIVWSLLSALTMLVVLGLALSGVVFFAKIITIITMASVIFVLIGSLFTKAGPGPKVVGLVKKLFGYSLLAAGSSAIVILVTWMTQTLMSLGTAIFPAGSIVALIWTGISPILALIALHMLFKAFKLPSPLTPKGALAWGAAGGAAGSVIGSGIADKLANRGAGAARKAGSGILHKATGGKLGAPMTAGGNTRAGAGAPKAPEVTVGDKAQADTRATREELAEARAFAKNKGEKIPMTAQERANAVVKSGFGAKNIKQVPAKAGGALSTGDTVFEGVKAGFLAKTSTIRNLDLPPAERKMQGVLDNARFAETDVAKRIEQTKENVSKKLDAKRQAIAENPAGETWKMTKSAGTVAKTALKVGGLGAVMVATGGVAAPFIAKHYVSKQVTAVRTKRDAAQIEMVNSLRQHKEKQAIAETQAAKDRKKQERKAASAADEAKRAAAKASGQPGQAVTPAVTVEG